MSENLHADVLVAGELPDDLVRELTAQLFAAGVTAAPRAVAPRRSLSDVAWLVLLALPLKPFVDQLAKDAAADTYERLTMVVGAIASRLRRRPTNASPVVMVLQDATSGVRVVLEADLPHEAMRRLAEVDLGSVEHGPLHYDRHRRRWRSELDEARAPRA